MERTELERIRIEKIERLRAAGIEPYPTRANPTHTIAQAVQAFEAAETGGDWKGYIDNLARENAPIGRFASPEEAADFFIFLCSDRASYSVGSTYFVDGGMLKTI